MSESITAGCYHLRSAIAHLEAFGLIDRDCNGIDRDAISQALTAIQPVLAVWEEMQSDQS